MELNCRLIDEVWARYGHHAAFGGWYISQECSRNTGKIIDLYARLGRHCKAVSGGLPTLISPYIDGSKNISQYTDRTTRTGGVTAESHEAEWDAIFRGIQGAVDIVAFQDGHVEYDELPEFLRINKRLADRYGLECWTNTETFDRDMPIKFLQVGEAASEVADGRGGGYRSGHHLRILAFHVPAVGLPAGGAPLRPIPRILKYFEEMKKTLLRSRRL